MRAAQMAYDFEFLGAPMVYSWSSKGAVGLMGMQHDQENLQNTVSQLREFVLEAQQKTSGSLHLVAHSMGNRALVEMLKRLTEDPRVPAIVASRPGRTKLFGEIVLAAPDVNQGSFTSVDAAAVQKLADRVSLYVADDRALEFARIFSSNRRIGESGKGIFVEEGVETINAAGADKEMFSLRHSYPFHVQKVLEDLAAVIVRRAKATDPSRKLHETKTEDQKIYWSLIAPKS